MFIYFLREREIECEWERVRERETQNSKQAPGSECLMRGSNSRMVRSDLSRNQMLNGLSHPGAPSLPVFYLDVCFFAIKLHALFLYFGYQPFMREVCIFANIIENSVEVLHEITNRTPI